MSFSVSIGPEPTERQSRQRAETEWAAEVLRAAGFKVKVTHLMCGSSYPKADAAMITIEVHHDQ